MKKGFNLNLLFYTLQSVVTDIFENANQALRIAQNGSRTTENLAVIASTLDQIAQLASSGRANINNEVNEI